MIFPGSLSPVGVSVTEGRSMLIVVQAVTSIAPTNPDQTANFFTDIFVLVIGQRAMVHERAPVDLPQGIEYGTQPLKNDSINFTVMTASMNRATTACVLLVALFVSATLQAADKPKLIVQITVDQLRGDLPTRYYDRLGAGGFRYLWENGVVYRNAHHAHANTETIVGHATLATGAHPSIHGMVGNLWFDRETGFTTYNVEDPDYRLLTEGASVDADTEIDPTQLLPAVTVALRQRFWSRHLRTNCAATRVAGQKSLACR
jgi:hypothetical protein